MATWRANAAPVRDLGLICGHGLGIGAIARRSSRLLGGQSVERQIELEHVHPRLAQEAQPAVLGVGGDQLAHLRLGQVAGGSDAGDLELGCGRADVADRARCPTRSPDRPGPARAAELGSTLAFTRSTSAALVGPRFEPLDAVAS